MEIANENPAAIKDIGIIEGEKKEINYKYQCPDSFVAFGYSKITFK